MPEASKNLVFVGNNVRASELSASLPEKNVLFGFAFSAGHREKDRVVSIDFRKIMIGPLKSAPFNKDLIRKIFADTGYQVIYQPNMEDYLLCHAAFVVPVVFACYKTEGNLKKLRHENDYLNQVLDATIEGYRAVEKAGHEILPQSDKNYEGKKYHRTCFLFLKLMCGTVLGKICVSDHAMNAVDEMSALNEDLKAFFNENGAEYPIWKRLEEDAFLQYKSGKPHEENRTP